MTIPELLEVCESAKDFLKNFDKPVAWLTFRRLLGPTEIILLLEEHAAVGKAIAKTARPERRTEAGVAHRATDAALSALVIPDPGEPLGQFVETGTRERIHIGLLTDG